MSFAKLPYAFKKRLVFLAPLKCIQSLAKAYPDVKDLCNSRPEFQDQVKIVDSPDSWFCRFVFWFVVGTLRRLKPLRYFIDGPFTITPVWDSVLFVDDIAERKRAVYVSDTLILHCQSAKSYEKVIPFITGPYSRLILYGNINCKHVKQLISANVKQVRINARIYFEPEERIDMGNFVVQFCRCPESKFSYDSNVNSIQIKTDLEEALRNCKTFTLHATPNGVHVISSWMLQFFFTLLSPLLTLYFWSTLSSLFDYDLVRFLGLIIFGMHIVIVFYILDNPLT